MSYDDRPKRKYTRFKGTPTEYAQISFREFSQPFENQMVGLITDEAFGGCGLVVLFDELMHVGARCRVRVGNVEPLRAEITYCKEIESDVLKVGLKFLE